MRIGFTAKHRTDEAGNPAGGSVVGTGFTVVFQDGPLGRGADRKAPNGAFVEDLIDAARDRLAWYQTACAGRFASPRNAAAIAHLEAAIAELDARTAEREARAVEGTHTP